MTGLIALSGVGLPPARRTCSPVCQADGRHTSVPRQFSVGADSAATSPVEALARTPLLTERGHVGHRKTAATLLDGSGLLTDRGVANQLGHKRASMTKDRYMSRHTVPEVAAEVF